MYTLLRQSDEPSHITQLDVSSQAIIAAQSLWSLDCVKFSRPSSICFKLSRKLLTDLKMTQNFFKPDWSTLDFGSPHIYVPPVIVQ